MSEHRTDANLDAIEGRSNAATPDPWGRAVQQIARRGWRAWKKNPTIPRRGHH